MNCNGTIDRDLDIRIQRANGAFHQLWKINKGRDRGPEKLEVLCVGLVHSFSSREPAFSTITFPSNDTGRMKG